VHKYQGRQPSGRMFNEIALDYHSKNNQYANYINYSIDKPHNPLVNSGAIMSAALILSSLIKPDLPDMAAHFEFVAKVIN